MSSKHFIHLGLLIVVGYLFVSAQDDFRVVGNSVDNIYFKKKPVYINETQTKKELNRILNKTAIHKKLQSMEKFLNKNPWIKHAEVYANRHQFIAVYIEESLPLMRIYDQTNQSVYINSSYQKMPIPSGKSPYTMICMNVPKQTTTKTIEHILGWADVIKLHPSVSNHFSYLNYKDSTSIEFIPKEGRPKIVLPFVKSKGQLINKLAYLYENVLPKVGWSYYTTLNFSYKNQIIAKK